MRDKNIFFIMIGIALVLVISVGYALFSETIAIKGTAKAEGTFDITAYCGTGLPETTTPRTGYNRLIGGSSQIFEEKGYSNDSCNADNVNNIITFTTDLDYPGAQRYFYAKYKNTGTIDAIIDLSGDGILEYSKQRCTGENYNTCVDDEGNFDIGDFIGFSKDDSTIIYTLSDNYNNWSEFVDLTNYKIILKPGESMYFTVQASWEDDEPEAGTVSFKDKLTLAFKFDQKTVS